MAASQAQIVGTQTAVGALANVLSVAPQNTVGYAPGFSFDFLSPDGVPLPPFPPSPILFHYEGEQRVVTDAEITDHYIEDNTAIHDQIALKPVVITTHGFIGEQNDVPPFPLQILKTTRNALTAIGAYKPIVSLTAQISYNEAFFFYQTALKAKNAAVSAFSSLAGTGGESVVGANGSLQFQPNQNLQQTYYQQFYYYQQSRTPFTVQTPWAIFSNMYIQKLEPVQDETTNVITDFHVSFKMVRTAVSALSGALGSVQTAASFGGQLYSQASSLVDLGIAIGSVVLGIAAGLQAMGVILTGKQKAAAPT